MSFLNLYNARAVITHIESMDIRTSSDLHLIDELESLDSDGCVSLTDIRTKIPGNHTLTNYSVKSFIVNDLLISFITFKIVDKPQLFYHISAVYIYSYDGSYNLMSTMNPNMQAKYYFYTALPKLAFTARNKLKTDISNCKDEDTILSLINSLITSCVKPNKLHIQYKDDSKFISVCKYS